MARNLMTSALKILLCLFVQNSWAAHRLVRRCCKEGERLNETFIERLNDSPHGKFPTQLECLQTSEQPSLPIFESDGDSPAKKGTFDIEVVSEPSLCGGAEVEPHYFVDKIFTDGFLLFHGRERPYACVDFAINSDDNLQAVGLFCGPNHPPWQTGCPEGAICLEKCCREGSLLVHGSSSKPVCREGNDSDLWHAEEYEESLGPDLHIPSSSIFFKTVRNIQVCYDDRREYKIQSDGLFSVFNQSVSSSFCVDNLWNENTQSASEVVVTQPENCHKEHQYEGLDVTLVLFTISSVISLICLVLIFLVYWFLPDYQHLKGKIILVNVTFTSFLYGFLLLFYFTKPSSFYFDCAATSPICKFIEDYICTVIGYHGYFIFIGTFAWVTIFGFNLLWSVHKMLRPDEVDDRSFGFLVQLSAGPGMSLLVVLLLVLQDLTSWPLGASISPHRAALATLVSCTFWLLLLLADLSWTMTRQNAPAVDSDNSTLRIAATVGLGVPLLLTGVLAIFHISLPPNSILNPQMGEQEKCFLSSGHHSRILILYHLPIFLIILLNLGLFSFIIWVIVKTKNVRNNESQHENNNYRRELRKMGVLYAKLFLVFGITWILAPLRSVLTIYNIYNTPAQIFTQITSVLNLLRGVFMFLLFVSPAKVKIQINRWRRVRQGGATREMTLNATVMNTSDGNTSMVNTSMTNKTMNNDGNGTEEAQTPLSNGTEEAQTLLSNGTTE